MDTIIIFTVVAIFMVLSARASGNPVGHETRFLRRRAMNWLPLGLTYSFLYMARYNLTVSKVALGGLMSKEDFGTIFAAGTITYAFAFLINGPLTDRIGGKRAILISAFGASIMNALLGVLTYLILTSREMGINLVLWFSLIYSANMYFQSYGAVAIVKVNSNWFHVRERGSFGGMFGILIASGIFFAFDWGAAIVQATSVTPPDDLGLFQAMLRNVLVPDGTAIDQTWWVFFIPAGILFVFACLDVFILRDTPAQAGLANFDTADASSGDESDGFSLKEILKKVLTNRVILTIALIEFCSGVLRNGVMHWYPIYCKELGVSKDFLFQQHWGLILMIAGSMGGVFAGYLSDKVFGSRRGPVAALLYGTMAILSVTMIFSLHTSYLLGTIVSLMSFAIIGVHGMLSGTATMDFGGRKGAGTAVGVIDGFVYLGTGVQSLALGYITSRNWAYWPVFLVPFAVIGLWLAMKIWRAYPGAAKQGHGAH